MSEQEGTIKRKSFSFKFTALLALLVGYFLYLSYTYDVATGGVVSALTWSFFVLCTPIADAGFLLDFPIRLLFGLRMIYTEIMVWGIAIAINIVTLWLGPDYYQATALTKVFYQVLVNPLPYWSIVVVSGVGTFLSIKFGDEIMDVFHHKDRLFFLKNHAKYELILIAFGFLATFFLYFALVEELGLEQVLTHSF